MTARNVLTFYAQSHWGTRYNVTDAAHKTPHKGLDCGLFHGIVDVPALHDGTVVAAAANPNVGHYVTIERADGLFDTYCHIVIGVKVGQAVKQGDRLGRQATTQAEGGVQWEGQHTHLCLSRTRDGWGIWGYVNLDPTPGVIAVLTGTASSSASPLNERHRTMFSIVPLGTAEGIDVVSLVTGVRAHIATPYHLGLLQRVRDNNGADEMLPAEVDIVRGYLSQINPSGADAASVATSLTPIIKSATTDALIAAIKSAGVTVDNAAIAKAVDAALADNFAALTAELPGAVVKAEAAALSN